MWTLKLMIFISVLLKYVIAGSSDKKNMPWDYTASPEDVHTNHIELTKLYMNTSIDPCDDFYEYSCGNWKNANELHSKFQSVLGVLNEKVQQALKEFMEESSVDGDKNEESFKLFYKSCMNTNLISERANQPAIDFLKTLDGWPMVDSKSSDEHVDWLHLSAKLALYDQIFILRAYTRIDFNTDDTSQDTPVIYVMPTFPHPKYSQDEFENISLFIVGEAFSDTILDEISTFNQSFLNAFSGNYYVNASTLTLEELLIEDPHIDWERYLSILLQKPVHSNQKVKAPVSELKGIGAFLSNTSSRIIANYILYNAMMDKVNDFININAVYRGSTTREEYCFKCTEKYFLKNLSKRFVDKYLDESANDRAKELSEEIREAFSEFIGNRFWIDEQTKEIAKEKLNNIQLKVGYTAKNFENYLNYPELKSDEYFENAMKLRQYEVKTLWFVKPKGTTDMPHYITHYDTEAFYLRDVNTTGNVYITAGLLQPPLFNKYIPNWSNYGGIGHMIGHEITHGFNVRHIKARANETYSEWWSTASFKQYMIRTLCYKFQYDKYKFEDIEVSVHGQYTLAENMADNGGLKFGYEAYKKWLNNHIDSNENQVNPVINLNGEQLYFVSFAQRFCNALSKEDIEDSLRNGVHTPPKFRVIGSVSNSFDFAKAFQCPIGSAMNPPRKCQF